jgi:hypothetical protein
MNWLPANALTIRLEPDGRAGYAVTVGLATPAHPAPPARRRDGPLALTRQIRVDQSGDDWVQFQFDLPDNMPAGLYVPYLQVGDGLALTPGSGRSGAGCIYGRCASIAMPANPTPARLDIQAESGPCRI